MSGVNKKNTTVIAFYPGGGGNRYLLSLLEQEFSTLGVTYDKQFSSQLKSLRWLMGKIDAPLTTYCLTHCMNATHIENTLSPKNIIFIDTDLQQSLQRQWYHNGIRLYRENLSNTTLLSDQILLCYQDIKDPSWPTIYSIEDFNNLEPHARNEVIETMQINAVPLELGSAWETINWCCQYYNKYPVEFKNHQVVSILDDTLYAKVMREELARYQSEIFSFCWDIYHTKGNAAPIVDLYNQHRASLRNKPNISH